MTVSAAGKISGKFSENGTNWTFTAASYTAAGTRDACPYQFVCSNVVAKYSWKVKSGKKTETKTLTREFVLSVEQGAFGGVATLVEAARSASGPYQSGLIRIGFAAETGAPAAEAVRKCREKGLDLVVGNDVSESGSGFGTTTNRVTFVTPDGRVQRLPLMSKLAVARRIVRFAESAVAGRLPYQSTAAQRKGANA